MILEVFSNPNDSMINDSVKFSSEAGDRFSVRGEDLILSYCKQMWSHTQQMVASGTDSAAVESALLPEGTQSSVCWKVNCACSLSGPGSPESKFYQMYLS